MHKASGRSWLVFFSELNIMFYIGIDVSKAKLDCSLLLEVERLKRKSKAVANSKSGVSDLLDWAAKHGALPAELHAVMEGTGVYHEQAALALCDAGVTVSIVNPAQARDFAKGLAVRTKTDGVDSLVLARYGALLKPAAWTPPSREARALQALLRRRPAAQRERQSRRPGIRPSSRRRLPMSWIRSSTTSLDEAGLKDSLTADHTGLPSGRR